METLDCGLMSHTGDPSEFLSKSFTSMAGRMGKRTSIRTNQNWLGAGPKKVAMEGAIKSFPTASLPRKQTESQATEIGKSRDVSPPRLLSTLASGRNLAYCMTLNTLSTLPFIPVEMLCSQLLWAGGKAFL